MMIIGFTDEGDAVQESSPIRASRRYSLNRTAYQFQTTAAEMTCVLLLLNRKQSIPAQSVVRGIFNLYSTV